jgi:hypothetical protein
MKLRKWHIGYIPNTIIKPKKITAAHIELAELGYQLFYTSFGVKQYFTQALITGAKFSPLINHLAVITPTRYGKSFNALGDSIILANMVKEVSIVGWDKSTANIIMDKVRELLPVAHQSLTKGLIESGDKIDKLLTQVSKAGLVWNHGGSIKTYSAKDTYEDSRKKGTGFIGIGGDIIVVDESALLTDSSYSTIMRSFIEKENTKIIEYSNPHALGHFSKLMKDGDYNVTDKVFRVWINKQTAIEEGRFNAEKIKQAEANMDRRSIRIFYDCEFDLANTDNILFTKMPNIIPPTDIVFDEVFAGLDCAYTGNDKTRLFIVGVKEGVTYIIASHQFDPEKWDVDTYKLVAQAIVTTAKRYSVASLAIDIGGVGALLFEAIRSEYPSFDVYDINFANKVTVDRINAENPEKSDPIAVQAFNKRAEMYIDLANDITNSKVFIYNHLWNEDTEKQFVGTEYKMNKGKYQLLAKEELKKKFGHSPDELDAIVLANHAKVLYNIGKSQSKFYIV